MANILLLGSASFTESFVRVMPAGEEHHIVTLAPEVIAAGELMSHLLAGAISMGAQIDAVVDLTCEVTYKKEKLLSAMAANITPGTVVYVNALTITATAAAELLGDGIAVLGISWVPALTETSRVIEAAPALQASPHDTARAVELLREITGKEVETVVDRLGLVSGRILAMVINEAAFALMEGVADAADIDTAMKLGTNYPEGPLAWVDKIGADVIVALLEALYDEYHEERYRPCVLLKQHARAGKAFI